MRVKICGIRRLEDALLAVDAGADAIGLLVGQKHTSSDFIDVETAHNIVTNIPPFCSSVLVTHLTDVHEIIRLIRATCVNTVQLHEASTPQDIEMMRSQLPYIKYIKAIHVTGDSALEESRRYAEVADSLLLDTTNVTTGQIGGTGTTHDWSISARIVTQNNIPVILAGGLNPSNVQDAIRTVNPFGVDVNSGVKAIDGFKDEEKLRSFIKLSKTYFP